jgi:hypothetical protein
VSANGNTKIGNFCHHEKKLKKKKVFLLLASAVGAPVTRCAHGGLSLFPLSSRSKKNSNGKKKKKKKKKIKKKKSSLTVFLRIQR